MNENRQFYKMTFEMITGVNLANLDSNMEYSKSRIEELIDLTNYKPNNALELGSGMGLEAINLNLMGVQVDAIEIVEELNCFAGDMQNRFKSNVNFINKDFFEFAPKTKYDLIYYLDGFGVSSHDDQIKLLENICNWLNNNGTCIIEVYNPRYWKKADGIKMKLTDNVNREYGFNYEKNAFSDTWTSSVTNYSYTQTLQCYSPSEITNMIEDSSLVIDSIHPGGAMDFEKWEYKHRVTLEECLNYKVILKKKI